MRIVKEMKRAYKGFGKWELGPGNPTLTPVSIHPDAFPESVLNPRHRPEQVSLMTGYGRCSLACGYANKSAVRLHLRHGDGSQLMKHSQGIKIYPVVGGFALILLA